MLLPKEKKLLRSLQRQFDDACLKVRAEATRIVQARASLYDVETPVWHRVEWPQGYLHEVSKKSGRIRNELAKFKRADEVTPEIWAKMREEALDMVNYLVFFVAFGDMLQEDKIGNVEGWEEREGVEVEVKSTKPIMLTRRDL